MRIAPIDIQGAVNLDRTYVSRLPALPDLTHAYADPVQSRLLNPKNPTFGLRLQEDAVALLRDVTGRMATQTGIATSWIPKLDAITAGRFDPDWLKLAKGGVLTGIDIAFQAIGAVPIVGWLARTAARLVFAIIDAALAKTPYPPQRLAAYNKADNDQFANDILNVIGSSADVFPNWSPIFRPPAVGPWERLEAHYGYVFQVRGADAGDVRELDGFGLLPNRAWGLLQLNVNWESIATAQASGGGFGGLDIMIRDIQDMTNLEIAQYIRHSAYDVTAVRQTGIRAAVAAWQAIKTKTAAVFNVDTRGIVQEWVDYVAGALEITDRYIGSTAKSTRIEQAELDRTTAFAAQTLLYDWDITSHAATEGAFTPSGRRADMLVAATIEALRNRQEKALRTRAIAYCSERQTAFDDPQLAAILRENRKLLLKHPDVQNVELEDVIDADYRSEVYRAQMHGAGFGLAQRPGHLVAFPAPDAMPGGGAWPDSVRSSSGLFGVSWVWWLVAAGAGYLGYRAWKDSPKVRRWASG